MIYFLLTGIALLRKELYGTLVRMAGYVKKFTHQTKKTECIGIKIIPAKIDFSQTEKPIVTVSTLGGIL